ncbi:hypothetical protein LL3_01480 [Bacillus amyloliquefaciens LL3]|nr:hypothetical protein LL3_01480 [Bacillus amyloliquefaciens LL3]
MSAKRYGKSLKGRKKTSKPGGSVLAASLRDGCWMAARLFYHKIGNIRL